MVLGAWEGQLFSINTLYLLVIVSSQRILFILFLLVFALLFCNLCGYRGLYLGPFCFLLYLGLLAVLLLDWTWFFRSTISHATSLIQHHSLIQLNRFTFIATIIKLAVKPSLLSCPVAARVFFTDWVISKVIYRLRNGTCTRRFLRRGSIDR